MTPLYVQATGKYEKVNVGYETIESFCKRKCFEAGAPYNSFDIYDNWKELFHMYFKDFVIVWCNIYRLYDVNESLANGDEGSIIGDNSFVLYYDNNNYSLRDAFQINK